jgi:hypothetical protein
MVLYGSPTAGATPVVRDLTSGNVSLTVTFENGVPTAMRVAITGFTVDWVLGRTMLNGKPRATYSYQGVWAPL